jgi:Flp pilus assembly protein TadD
LTEKKCDLDKAFIYAQKAKAATPEQPAILDTVGWILTKRGSYELALSNLEEAIQRWPNQPTIRYHLAVALKGMKKFDAAKEELRKAINTKEEFPEIEDARRLLEELS